METVYGFTAKTKGISRVILSDVFISQSFDPANTTITPPHNQYTGIWDTGATNSVITQKVVDDCHLKPIGMARVNHCNGVSNVEVFFINMMLPNKIGIVNLRVTKGILLGENDVLIGMDVISKGDFCISNFNNNTWFTFRIPSSGSIDFKDDYKNSKITSPVPTKISLPSNTTIGRRAPCPCGSGKRYKNCCGK